MSQQRRRFDAAEKVKIIREHLLDKRPLSEVCAQYGIAPTQFYQWQKQFFEQGAAVFEPKKITVSKEYELEAKVKKLTRKLTQKDEVIAEIMASHVALKKVLARTERHLGRAGCTRRGRRLCAALVGKNGD